MDAKKRILYIHGGGDTIGGLETYLAKSLKHHKRYKPYLGIVKKGRFTDYIKELGIENVLNLDGGRLRELHKTLKAVLNAVKFIKINNVSLIIAHGTHAWIFAWLIAKISRIKSIFFIQGIIQKNDFKRHDLVAIGLRMKPDLYISNSEFSASSIKKYLSNNVYVNHLAADISDFDKIDEDESKMKLRKEFQIDENKLVFSVVGRIQEWKGQDVVIKSFNNMHYNDRVCILIVGDCTFEEDNQYYNQLLDLAGENPNVIFTGFRKDIPYIMKGSDVIIHSSNNPEPFGIVIVEGMMSKKPVIATAHGGPLEIIDNNKDGLLYEPANYKQLSSLMDKVVRDKGLREKLSRNAYIKSKNNFSMEKSISNLEKIISYLN